MNKVEPVIRLSSVTKRFGRFTAVDEVNLTVSKGEIVGFVGANGAGKTTTISLLLGFLRPSQGNVELFGKPVTTTNSQVSHQRIGYAAGDMELPPQLTGRQYLAFLRHQGKVSPPEQYADLLKRFSPQLDKKIHTLSRGNKQKLALVAAFLGDPELIILDEPTSGLDPVMQELFLELVRKYQGQGKTVFMSSHYLQEVMDVCSRVILMSKGKVVQDKQTSELLLLGGKKVSIKSGYRPTKPPKHAESVETTFEDELLTLSFVYKGSMSDLQPWLSSVKQLRDLEISEYNLEETFRSLYEMEKTA